MEKELRFLRLSTLGFMPLGHEWAGCEIAQDSQCLSRAKSKFGSAHNGHDCLVTDVVIFVAKLLLGRQQVFPLLGAIIENKIKLFLHIIGFDHPNLYSTVRSL